MRVSQDPRTQLNDLIAAIDAASSGPADRLDQALRTSQELAEVADSLLEHYVELARTSGMSWSDIGRRLGTSKQAAQKRFAHLRVEARMTGSAPSVRSQGFAAFTPAARAVTVAAQAQARQAGNSAIGVGHLLLALLQDPNSFAGRALAARNVSIVTVERAVMAALPPAGAAPNDPIPFDPSALAALDGSLAEAGRLRAPAVGPEHLLLAVLRQDDGKALAGSSLPADDVEALIASGATANSEAG